MRRRILAPVLASAILATTISMLAACGSTAANPAPTGHQSSAAAPSGPSVASAPGNTDPGQAHAAAPASPGSNPAAGNTPKKSSLKAGKQQHPKAGKQHPKAGTQHPKAGTQPSASGAGPVRFGTVTSEDSTAAIGVSPDGEALTTTFSDLETNLEQGVLSNGTRMVMPLTGGAQNAQITIYASGYAFTEGATARLTLTVNGQPVVKDFPVGTDSDFVQQFELPVIAGSECQVSIALEVDQAPGSDGGAAYLNVSTIDAEIT